MRYSIKRLVILKKVSKQKISPDVAYEKLYNEKIKKPKFIYFRMWLKEYKFLSLIIRIFTLLPLPICLIKPLIRIAARKNEQVKYALKAIDYAKETSIAIKTVDVKLKIRMK